LCVIERRIAGDAPGTVKEREEPIGGHPLRTGGGRRNGKRAREKWRNNSSAAETRHGPARRRTFTRQRGRCCSLPRP
jgi:hypothetical protein